jgi:D-alanyl-D-alanine carboxypeptidase/D-alanyl-D-alanine-endopeptidase (penicillin-binding protein 4)
VVWVRTTGWRGGAALLALVAATLTVGAGAAVVLRDDAGLPAAEQVAPSPTPLPSRPALLPAVADDEPAPAPAGLAAAVQGVLADPALGGALAVSVIDAETGEPLHEQRADVLAIPASTTKIATAIAVLATRDPRDRLSTRVVAGSAPGEVVLVGGGDPTLATPVADVGYPDVAQLGALADQVRAALGAAPLTKVVVDASLYAGPQVAPGWKPSYVSDGHVAPVTALMVDGGRVRPDRRQRSPDPALAAGSALAGLLQPAGAPPVTVEHGTAAAGAQVIGEVQSPTIAQLAEEMLLRSDNDIAEALARQVALAEGQLASFDGVAAALRSALAPALVRAGVPPEAVQLVDGSGLSRENLLAPAATARLLAAVVAGELDRFSAVVTGLPVAGFSGTLSERYRAGEALPAAGAVRAKTGTLNGVSALAGLVRTADGRLLAFALAADAVPMGATRGAEAALDRLAASFAACGC